MAKSRRVKKRNGHKSNVEEDPGPDISLLSRPSATSVKGLRDVLKAFDEGTPEVNHLLSNECEIIYECRVCRSLYRSFLNFITHKRIYCQQQYTSGSPKASHFFNDVLDEDETLVVHDETGRVTRQNIPSADSATSMEVDCGPSSSSKPKAVPRKNLTEILGMLSQKASSFDGLNRLVNLDGFAELGNDSASTGFKGRLPRQHLLHLESMESTDVAIRQTVTLGPDGKILPTKADDVSDDDDEDSSQNHESRNKPDEMETNLLCSKCNSRFSSRKTFKHHMNSVHDPSRVSYVCPCCRRKFANSWSVHRHLKSVHNKTNEQLRKLRDQIQKVVRRVSTDTESSGKVPPSKQLSPKEYASKEQQKTYLKRCSEMEVFEKEYKKCSGCSRKFDRFAAFNYHVQNCAQRIAALKNIKLPTSSASIRVSNSARNVRAVSPLTKQTTTQITDSVADTFLSKPKPSARNTATPSTETTSESASATSTDQEDQATVVPSTAILASLKPRERHNSDKRPDFAATKKIEIQLRRDYNKITVVPTVIPDASEINSSPTTDSNGRARIDYKKLLPTLNPNIPLNNKHADEIDSNEDEQIDVSNACSSLAISEPQENDMDDASDDSSVMSTSARNAQSRIDKIGLMDRLSLPKSDNLMSIFSTSKGNETSESNSNDNFAKIPDICNELSANQRSRSNSILLSNQKELIVVLNADEASYSGRNGDKLYVGSGRLSNKSSRRNSLCSEDFPGKGVVTNDINSNDSLVLEPVVRSGRLSNKTSRRNSLNNDEPPTINEAETKDNIVVQPKIRSERLFNRTIQKIMSNSEGLSPARDNKTYLNTVGPKANIRSVRSRIDVKKTLGNRPNPADKPVASTSYASEISTIPNRSINKLRSKLDKMRQGSRLLHSVSVRTSKRMVSKAEEKSRKMNSDSRVTTIRRPRIKVDSKVSLVKKQLPLLRKLDKSKCGLPMPVNKIKNSTVEENESKLVDTKSLWNLESKDNIIRDANMDEVGSNLEGWNLGDTGESDNLDDLNEKSSGETNTSEMTEETNIPPKSILESILLEKNENNRVTNCDQKLTKSVTTMDSVNDTRKKLPPVVKRASIMEWNGFEEQYVSAVYGFEQEKKRFKRYDGGEVPYSSVTSTDVATSNDPAVEKEHCESNIGSKSVISSVQVKDNDETSHNSSSVPVSLLTNTKQLGVLPMAIEEMKLDSSPTCMIQEATVTIEETTVTIDEKPVTIDEEPVTIDDSTVTIDEEPVTIDDSTVTIDEAPPPSESSEQDDEDVIEEIIVRSKADVDEEILKVIFEPEDLSQSYSLTSKKATIIMDNGTFSLRPCSSDDSTNIRGYSSKIAPIKHLISKTQESDSLSSCSESLPLMENEQSPIEITSILSYPNTEEVTCIKDEVLVKENDSISCTPTEGLMNEDGTLCPIDVAEVPIEETKFRRLSSLAETESVISAEENEVRPSSAVSFHLSSSASSDVEQSQKANVTPSSSIENQLPRSRPYRNRVKVKNDDFIYDTDKSFNTLKEDDDLSSTKQKSSFRTSQKVSKQEAEGVSMEPQMEMSPRNPQVMLYRTDDSNRLGVTCAKQGTLIIAHPGSSIEEQSNNNSAGYNASKRKSVRVNTKQ